MRRAWADAIQLVADLPSNSKTRVDLTNALIDELWHSLQHPPLNYLGPKYMYRSADGSNNVSSSSYRFELLLNITRTHSSPCWELQTHHTREVYYPRPYSQRLFPTLALYLMPSWLETSLSHIPTEFRVSFFIGLHLSSMSEFIQPTSACRDG